MQYIDVLVEDQGLMFARVEYVSGDTYTVRYMGPTKRAGVYDFEDTTYNIDRESVDHYYDGEKDLGYIRVKDGWAKTDTGSSSDSEYEPSESEDDTETEEESLEDEDEEEAPEN